MIASISPQDSSPAADSQGQTASPTAPSRHWLDGRYFVPMPDISDETAWRISQGRAWPVFMAIQRLLHQIERKGSTEGMQQQAAAGTLSTVGVNGLARVTGMSETAVLRQLRFLAAEGLIETQQDKYASERHPDTGKIVRNFAKAPPKVITMTIRDRHMRPTKASQGTHVPNPNPAGGTHVSNAKAKNLRVRNEGVSKESDLHRDRIPSESDRRLSAAGLGKPAAAADTRAKPDARQPRPQPQATGGQRPQQWQANAKEASKQAWLETTAANLGISQEEVWERYVRDKDELRRTMDDAGLNPNTGKFKRPAVTGLGFHETAALIRSLSLNDEPAEAVTDESTAFQQGAALNEATAALAALRSEAAA